MWVTGLDGRSYKWKLTGHLTLDDDDRPRSRYHLRARALLERLFPLDVRLEEVPLPGSPGLTADFYLPNSQVMVEVQGEQHYRFVPFFHETELGFMQSKQRDNLKSRWCELNDITLVELPFHESDAEWARRILGLGQDTSG